MNLFQISRSSNIYKRQNPRSHATIIPTGQGSSEMHESCLVGGSELED